MPSTYSTNLKIELMATGENSGTWGTVTNTNLGTAVEQAIVGYGNPDFTTDANLTITLSDSNSLQAARALVLNVTSTPSLSATRELIVPTIQKQYIVQNNTSGSQSITVKTSAGTGITVPNGRKAHLYVDGTNVIQMFDFVDINGGSIDGATVGAASASTGAFTTLTASGATTLNGAVALGDAAADLITVPGTINSNVIFTDNTYDIGASGATRPRTVYVGTSVVTPLLDVDNLRLDGNTLSSTDSNGNVVLAPNGTGDVQLDADTVRIGDSNANATITTNGTGDLILNTNAGTNSGSITIEDGVNGNIIIAPNGTGQVQISNAALDLTTIEVTNIKAKDGTASMTIADSTGAVTVSTLLNVDNLRLDGNTLSSTNTNGAINLTPNGTGQVTVTNDALIASITVGRGAGAVSTNTAVGASALAANTSGAYNTALGTSALSLTQGGSFNTGLGWGALALNVSGAQNTAVGQNALYNNTGDYNTAVGRSALTANTSGGNNVAIGHEALISNTTASFNTAVGVQAGFSNTTGNSLAFFGYGAGLQNSTGSGNAAFGFSALTANTTGVDNTAVGSGVYGARPAALEALSTGSRNTAIGAGAGGQLTTGSANSILGRYNGNQGGLDIRTANNYIVLSDGDGNPRQIIDGSGNLGLGVTPSAWGSAFRSLDMRTNGAGFSSSDDSASVNVNSYNNSGWKFKGTSIYRSSRYDQFDGTHAWHIGNTGAADTAITFTQAMTLDASGNLLVGGTSNALGARAILENASGNQIGLRYTGVATYYNSVDSSGNLIWTKDGSERARITSDGNLLVGTQSVTTGVSGTETTLTLQGGSSGKAASFVAVNNAGTGSGFLGVGTDNNTYAFAKTNHALIFGTNNTERARITSDGYFKASDAGTYVNAAGAYHELRQTANNIGLYISSTNASLANECLYITADRNTTNNSFYAIAYFNNGAAAAKFRVADSGDVTNTNGTYGTISDAKMKTDIVDAGSQWSDIKALRFRKFKMKDDPSGLVQLGVVAQEVEQTSPGLVDEHADKDAEGNDLGTTTKSVKTSILLMKAAVALQEAMARIEQLEAKVASLEAK